MAAGISLDSLDESKHDAFRGLAQASKMTMEGIEHLKEAGIPFQIHTTVMDWNSGELEAITDLAVKIGLWPTTYSSWCPPGAGLILNRRLCGWLNMRKPLPA